MQSDFAQFCAEVSYLSRLSLRTFPFPMVRAVFFPQCTCVLHPPFETCHCKHRFRHHRAPEKKLFIQKYFKLGIECKLKLKAILMFISMSLEVSFYYLLYVYTGQDLCCCANQESVPSSQFKIYASYF